MFIDARMSLRPALQRSAMFCKSNAAGLATFRSSGARRIFLNLCSINISSLRDEELSRTSASSQISPEKQEVVGLLHRVLSLFRQTLQWLFFAFVVRWCPLCFDHRLPSDSLTS